MPDWIKYSIAIKGGIKKWGVGWTKSMAFLCKPWAMNNVARGYRYYINQYVPKKTGTLRKSARAKYRVGGEGGAGGNGTGSATIYWGTTQETAKYAHYQFVGDVYGPNKAVVVDGVHKGWRSPKGKDEKYNTHRKMGVPFQYHLHDGMLIQVKGYTTKGTKYNWIKEFHDDKGDFGETAVNIRAGRYLYEMYCIHTHTKPVGGKQVWHSWNQIKNRID